MSVIPFVYVASTFMHKRGNEVIERGWEVKSRNGWTERNGVKIMGG